MKYRKWKNERRYKYTSRKRDLLTENEYLEFVKVIDNKFPFKCTKYNTFDVKRNEGFKVKGANDPSNPDGSITIEQI